MARKKHLLEVLLEASRATGAEAEKRPKPAKAARPKPARLPKPPKPPREERERRRLSLLMSEWKGKWKVSLPAQAGAFVVLGLVATLLIANSIGLFRSRAGDLGGAEISTKAPDPLSEGRAVPASGPTEIPMEPVRPAEPPREWGVRLATYENKKANEALAIEAGNYLTEQGIPDVVPWADVPDSQGKMWIVLFAGAFPTKDHPDLQGLLQRIRALPGPAGKAEKPFGSAMIARLPRTDDSR